MSTEYVQALSSVSVLVNTRYRVIVRVRSIAWKRLTDTLPLLRTTDHTALLVFGVGLYLCEYFIWSSVHEVLRPGSRLYRDYTSIPRHCGYTKRSTEYNRDIAAANHCSMKKRVLYSLVQFSSTVKVTYSVRSMYSIPACINNALQACSIRNQTKRHRGSRPRLPGRAEFAHSNLTEYMQCSKSYSVITRQTQVRVSQSLIAPYEEALQAVGF